MDAVQLAHPLGGGGAGVYRRLHRAHVAPDHDGDEAGADLLLADQLDIGRLHHGVCRLNRPDEAPGLHHSQC